jgi:hypothetical protein
LSFIYIGGNNIVPSKVSETEKRLMYWPPCNKSLISEFINAPKPNIQVSYVIFKLFGQILNVQNNLCLPRVSIF